MNGKIMVIIQDLCTMPKQAKSKRYGPRAASSLALVLVLAILVVEIVAMGLIVSYTYKNSRSTTLSVTVIGCDHVEAISDRSSHTLVVHNLHTGSARFPLNSRVVVNATPPLNGQIFGWYVIGSAENQSNQGTSYLLTLGGNSSVGVACG